MADEEIQVNKEIECLDVTAFAKWLQEDKGVEEEIVKKLEECGINGHIFMGLTDGDLKDLFDHFLVRKKLRDLQIEQRQLGELLETADSLSVPPPPPPEKKVNDSIASLSTPPPMKRFKFSGFKSPDRQSKLRETPMHRALNMENQYSSPSRDDTVRTIPSIPNSIVLSNFNDYSDKDVDNARVSIIRQCMDTLITLCGDRPTEFEVINLAQALAETYSILRDRPNEPARGNYRNVKKSLERRMYNVTPPRTNRGRKRGQKLSAGGKKVATVAASTTVTSKLQSAQEEQKEDASLSLESAVHNTEVETGVDENDTDFTASDENSNHSSSGSCVQEVTSNGPKDRAEENLDATLRRSTTANLVTVKRLLKLTCDTRKSVVSSFKRNTRLEEMLEIYPVFKRPEVLIENLLLESGTDSTVQGLEESMRTSTKELLDYIYAKNLAKVPRSALKTEGLSHCPPEENYCTSHISLNHEVMVAMAKLPVICKSKGSNHIKKLQSVVHIVKTDETWQEVAALHKSSPTPYLMFQRFGDQEIITLMIKTKPVGKATNAIQGILALMGLYYAADLEYPPDANGALLYIQKFVLHDNIHAKDQSVLNKAVKDLQNFQEEKTPDMFE